jgi:hypothetical protein
MSQGGALSSTGSGSGSPIETLTGNSGGAVGPDASFNIDVVGNNTVGIDIVGNPGTNTLTVMGIPSSTTQIGVIEIATNAETIAGTDTTRAVTPDDLTAKLGTQTIHGLAIGGGPGTTITWSSAGTSGQVLTSNGPASDPTFQAVSASGAITSITGNTGGAQGPLAGNFNIVGTGSTTAAGTANTQTIQLTGLTNHAVLIGAGTATITKVGPVASTGALLASNGLASDPGFTTATYPLTTTSQQILYSTANNVVGQLTTANSALAATNSSGTLAMRALSVVIQTFTANGTYTPTSGMLYCIIEALGGGGGGGGAAATAAGQASVGSGGGAGEYARGVFSAATIGASQSVTIGAAGAANSGAAGGAGGNTSVGALISANGGAGGATGAAGGGSQAVGAAGGTGGAGGSFRHDGDNGLGHSVLALTYQFGGDGANSQYGAGGVGKLATGAGNAASNYASGGSGAYSTNGNGPFAGGAGTAGLVVVTEYVIA